MESFYGTGTRKIVSIFSQWNMIYNFNKDDFGLYLQNCLIHLDSCFYRKVDSSSKRS